MAMHCHIRMKYAKYLLLFTTFHVFLSSCVALSGIYYDNGIDKTVVDKHLTRREKTEMEQEILDLLGLHHRPRPMLLNTKKSTTENENALNSAPRFLMDVYQSLTEEDSGELKLQPDLIEREFNVTRDDVTAMEEADIIMSFINHGRFFDGVGNFHGDGRFWFDMSEVPLSAAVMSAELRLYISRNEIEQNDNSFLNDDDDNDTVSVMDSAQSATEEGFILTLYQIFQGRTEGDLVYVDSIETETNQEGWVALNVSSSLKHWLEKPGENLGLQLVCRTLSGRQVSSIQAGVVGSHGEDKLQPFMVAFFRSVPQHNTVSASEADNAKESDEEDLSTPKSRRRIRRQTSNKKRSNKDTSNTDEQTAWNPYSGFDARYAKRSCQKKNLYVSFRDLEWQDWIIAPDGYAAFYCNGECSFPLNAHMNASNHAIVQTLVHLMNPYRVPKPCCAPIKLSPISVLYFDDTSNVILKKFRNMVVKSCGCH